MDNFVIFFPLFNCSQTHPLVSQHCNQTCSLCFCLMLTENQENTQCQYTLTNCTQYMDIDHSTFCSNYNHRTHLPWRNNEINHCKEANSHLVTTPSLQCHITHLPSTPTLWKFTFRSQYFSGHGKPKHDQYIIIKFSYMATPRETSEWKPASSLS